MLQNRGISTNLFVPIYPFKFFLLWELMASFRFIIQGLYVMDQNTFVVMYYINAAFPLRYYYDHIVLWTG